MSRSSLPLRLTSFPRSAATPDFDLQAKLYAAKPLPLLPLQPNEPQPIRRKPLRPGARVIGQAARFPMAEQRQDAAQDHALDVLPAQGRSSSSSCVPRTIAPSPPPKSPFRCAAYSSPATPASVVAAHRRRSSAKVHQLTGIDIDVFDDSPWKYGHFQKDIPSDSSSVYSQESTNNNSTMKSWQTTTDEIPPLERDQDANSSRVESWEPRSPPESASLEASPSLRRRPRTHRKSRDQHTLDNYHRIITDIASSPRALVSNIRTGIGPPYSKSNGPNPRSCTGQGLPRTADGMPPDFDIMMSDPRKAPRPPPNPIGPDGERLGSYFDANSDSDDEHQGSEGIFSTSGRARDSFLGMLLGRGCDDGDNGHHNRRSTTSVSTGAGRPSSEINAYLSDSAATEAVKAVKGSRSRRAMLKGLVEWAKKDEADEGERRRQELKQKITIHGGMRL